MSKLLEKAIKALEALPEAEQDAVAALVLAEIEDEAHWSKSFARSQDALERLARQAREEIARGAVRPGDPSDA
jgi:hypothetical protein